MSVFLQSLQIREPRPNGSIPRGLGTILGAVERLFRARTGNNRAKTQHFRHFWMSISRLSNARARARAAGFPRAGRKSHRRRRDKRADQPFAKIKELFKKISGYLEKYKRHVPK